MSIDLSYLKPPKEVQQVTHPPEYIYHGDKKRSVRKIFYGVEFSDFEKERMNDLANALEKESLEIPESWTDRNLCLLVYAGDFVTKKSVKAFKQLMKILNDPEMQELTPAGKDAIVNLFPDKRKKGSFTHMEEIYNSGPF